MVHELNLPKIARLLGVIDLVTIHPGDFVFHEGDGADGLFVVQSGLLQAIVGGTVYDTVTAGGIVGELAIVDEGRRSASVRASTHAELVKIDIPGFLGLVEHEPEFALTVMRVMAQRLRMMNRRQHADAA
jgi:CRP/FNR family cyclic AMP-dependent transcriptional regulator